MKIIPPTVSSQSNHRLFSEQDLCFSMGYKFQPIAEAGQTVSTLKGIRRKSVNNTVSAVADLTTIGTNEVAYQRNKESDATEIRHIYLYFIT